MELVKNIMRAALGCAIAGVAAMSGVSAQAQQTGGPVQLDLNRLRGTWYEVVRYPGKREKDCARNNFQLIAFGDSKNSVEFIDSCTGMGGDMDLHHRRTTQEKGGSDKLKMKRWLIFSTTYQVLGIGDQDAWMVIGSTNHKELWVLSKTRQLAPEVLADAESRAVAAGFTSAKLIVVPQDTPPTV